MFRSLEWAHTYLAPFGVTLYKNYDDILRHEGLQAVVIASATTVHVEQAIKAIEADKHVLCEKPLSTRVDVVSRPSCSTIGKLTPEVPICRRCRGPETTSQGDVRLLETL